MTALPLLLGALVAAAIAPAMLRAMEEGGLARENWRERWVPFPAGIVVVAAALVALAGLAPLAELADVDVFEPEVARVAVYALGMAVLGLVDDVVSAPPKGLLGHGKAVLHGSFSTGALKAVGAIVLAFLVLSGQGWDEGRYVLAVGVLVLATNLLNLLDLRPGRSTKALVLLGAGLTLGAWDARPAAALGLFLGPLLVVGLHDLRERAMLGDTGSNLAGGLAGLWLVLVLDTTGLAVALVLLLAVTVYGERRSITELVERTPPLRWLDCLGRPDAHR